MPTIQVKAQISAQELIEAAGQLDGTELEAVTDSLLVMRAGRRAPHLSREETALLLEINTPLPVKTWRRYSDLYAKLKPDMITPEEHRELKELIDVVEVDNARRIGNLIELAGLRGATLDAVIKSLELGPRSHA